MKITEAKATKADPHPHPVVERVMDLADQAEAAASLEGEE